MSRLLCAACALTLLAVSLPVGAEERSSPSPTTTARRGGRKLEGARIHGRKLEGSRIHTRRHGSDVDVRTGDDARRPEAAKITVRKGKG